MIVKCIYLSKKPVEIQWRVQWGARGANKNIKNEDLFVYNFVVKNVFCQYLYTIYPLQNTDFGVLQKSSKHFLISISFHLIGIHPARQFVPRTRALPCL